MKTKLKYLAILLAFSSLAFSQAGSIRANVVDENGEPIYAANVSLISNKVIGGTITDFDGWFHIKGVHAGYYTVEVSFVGYATKRITKVLVKQEDITFMNKIVLGVNPEMIGVVDVVRYKKKLIDPERTSGIDLPAKEIEKLPTKNIGMIIQAFSSDIQLSTDKKQILVRGSRPTSSAYFIDGVKMDDMSSGVMSGTIRNISVYTGGVPAKYGDLTGGCVVIETKSYSDFYNQWSSDQ